MNLVFNDTEAVLIVAVTFSALHWIIVLYKNEKARKSSIEAEKIRNASKDFIWSLIDKEIKTGSYLRFLIETTYYQYPQEEVDKLHKKVLEGMSKG